MDASRGKKILITGITGLLGSNLAEILSDEFIVYGISLHKCISKMNYRIENFDLMDKVELAKFTKKIRPDFIIHAAALANVDECERCTKEAYSLNVEVTENVADAARDINSRLIYISTDQVFDGKRGNYREDDRTNPVNFYGRTKLMGEEAVMNRSNEYVIVRTNFFGWSLRQNLNFAEWLLNSAIKKSPAVLFDDFIFNPLLVNTLSLYLKKIIGANATGIFHTGCVDSCSKYDFGVLLLRAFSIDIKKTNIRKGSISESTLIAKRPRNATLDSKKISAILGEEQDILKNEIDKFKKLFQNKYKLVKEEFHQISAG